MELVKKGHLGAKKVSNFTINRDHILYIIYKFQMLCSIVHMLRVKFYDSMRVISSVHQSIWYSWNKNREQKYVHVIGHCSYIQCLYHGVTFVPRDINITEAFLALFLIIIMLWDIADIKASWLPCIKIWGTLFSREFCTFSEMTGWIFLGWFSSSSLLTYIAVLWTKHA